MQILENKALLLPAAHTPHVCAAIAKSAALPTGDVVVHWGVREVHALRGMNIPAPSPIEGRYDWPGRFAPMAHQRETAAFLTLHKKAFCFSDPGTGKTASAIWAADFLMKQKLVRRALVICPVSIMDAAWRADLFTVAMHRTVDIAHGSAEKRRKVIEGPAEFVIINYDGVEIVEKELHQNPFDLIIVDEATSYKNTSTKRWKALARLVGPDTWLWMMTGTPAAQGPEDAYGLARLVNPRAVPRFRNTFRDMVMTKVSNFRWLPKPEATKIVFDVLQPAIRFAKEDCLDLPEMVYTRREVEMTKQQTRYYTELRSKLVFEAAGEQVVAQTAAVNLNKLLQIAAGAVYTESGDVLQFDIAPRYKVLREVLDETTNKVLIFVQHRHTIDMLVERLNADGITTAAISGSVKVSERTQLFHSFQTDKDPRVLVIQPQAAAHGVTLTAADTVVWWSPTPSLEIYEQANARVHRKGQKNACTVVQLYAAPVERKMYRLLDDKIDVHTSLIDMYKQLL